MKWLGWGLRVILALSIVAALLFVAHRFIYAPAFWGAVGAWAAYFTGVAGARRPAIVSVAGAIGTLCYLGTFVAWVYYFWTGPRFADWHWALRAPVSLVLGGIFDGFMFAGITHLGALCLVILGGLAKPPDA